MRAVTAYADKLSTRENDLSVDKLVIVPLLATFKYKIRGHEDDSIPNYEHRLVRMGHKNKYA